ncbi:hypothetical protein WA158_000136 [Blastocystis sp. Blastoise]
MYMIFFNDVSLYRLLSSISNGGKQAILEDTDAVKYDQNDIESMLDEKNDNILNDTQNINDFIMSTKNDIYPKDNFGVQFRKKSCYSSSILLPRKFGVTLFEFHNICFDFQSHSIIYFIENIQINMHLGRININVYSEYLPNVTIQFKEQFKNSNKFKEHPSVLYLVTLYPQQIAHFTETANILLSINMRFRKFPFFDTVLFQQEANHPYNWTYNYYNYIKSLYPSNMTFVNIKEAIEKYGDSKCFKHFYISTRLLYLSYGGIFSSIRDSDAIRILAYKHIGIDPSIRRHHSKPFITLFNHKQYHHNIENRFIINIDEIEQLLMSNFNNKIMCNYKIVATETLTFQKIVLLMVKTDILIGVIGRDLLNSIFMLPYSTIITIYPPYSDNIFFTASSRTSRIFVIPYYNISITYPYNSLEYNCTHNILHTFPIRNKCKKSLYYKNIYINPFMLLRLVQNAYYYFLFNQ